MVIELSHLTAKFDVSTITQALIGGYDASPYSIKLHIREGIRAQEIKGMWRWWLRVLLGGASWESNLRKRDEMLKQINYNTGHILGSTRQASKLLLNIDVPSDSLEGARNEFMNRINNLRRPTKQDGQDLLPPRMRLLMMGQPLEVRAARTLFHEPGLKFRITIKQRPTLKTEELNEEEERVALWSMLLYIVFGGIGAITRRGFGALKVEKVETKYEDITKCVEQLNNALDKESAEKALKHLIQQALQSAQRLLNIETKSLLPEELPPFPVLANGYFKYKILEINIDKNIIMKISELKITKDVSALALLKKLGDCTMKVQWKRHCGMKTTDHDYQLNTWILGLPRRVGPTGYFISEDMKEGRRPSSIFLKPLYRDEEGRWLIIKYGFLSKDWPEQLYHASGIRRSKLVYDSKKRECKIKKSFEQAWKLIDEILTSGG